MTAIPFTIYHESIPDVFWNLFTSVHMKPGFFFTWIKVLEGATSDDNHHTDEVYLRSGSMDSINDHNSISFTLLSFLKPYNYLVCIIMYMCFRVTLLHPAWANQYDLQEGK